MDMERGGVIHRSRLDGVVATRGRPEREVAARGQAKRHGDGGGGFEESDLRGGESDGTAVTVRGQRQQH
jgi:hypothetical protein